MTQAEVAPASRLAGVSVAVVDYGLANIQSVVNALECFTSNVIVAERPDQLAGAAKIVLPGVGHFDAGMTGLKARGHVEALNELVQGRGVPILGVCLGFQFLYEGSEEGREAGLGWLRGRCVKLPAGAEAKVPHMGWSEVTCPRPSRSMQELRPPHEFYFVHSYAVPFAGEAAESAVAVCEHGIPFIAAAERGHIFGTQFHPEKSQLAGMKMLETFLLL